MRDTPTESSRLGVLELLQILPHRYPMLMVDRIDDLRPGEFAEGIKCVTANEPFFQGHFPEHPIMPGVLIVESMAQVAGVMLRARSLPAPEAGSKPARPGVMASIQRMRFRRPVVPGDQLRVRATHLKSLGTIHQVKVEALVGEELVADGELMLGS
ncbi:3-hydroxyacyl-ACP dehydratase FabZ [Corallococcus sp. Z5C101001]|uniref:3-hydroxyacyl-ACP dehydratase FabZ n=1 Tax=Corallococcus sp. Z5C101001 TaxID=2596829 RepID=UPI00117D3AC8|nr:3-hydroxyacyl-ACP dehydratase FabZ [Corallococcus sp. Z5C101001]TSC23866.1 3-hydroxyacyl-ACP dehydratase FabZ [Corallococcus sp. Z5C101001]